MPSIKKIQDSLDKLRTFAADYSSRLKDNPDDLSAQLGLQSINSQIEELQQQLYHENLKREKEIIQLRIKGSIADYGSFPLSLAGKLTNAFSNAIFNSSKYFQYGNKGGKKIDNIISKSIDLRLEGLGKGSTVFYLSANTSPDLFGDSIIQNSLANVFELLGSESDEQFIENISLVGSHSIKYFSDFLKKLSKNDLIIDLSWSSPNDNVKTWVGSKDRIMSLYKILNNFKLNEPEEVDFEGEIITLSMKGKFEILTVENERIYGTFPNELIKTIKQLHIGSFCKGVFLKTTIFNSTTGTEKYEYALRDIALK